MKICSKIKNPRKHLIRPQVQEKIEKSMKIRMIQLIEFIIIQLMRKEQKKMMKFLHLRTKKLTFLMSLSGNRIKLNKSFV